MAYQHTPYHAKPENVGHNYCLCTCYACYHLCDQNTMVAMPMAAIKHLLHMERNKDTVDHNKNWDGTALYVGQNAPKKPEDFDYFSETVLNEKVLAAHRQVWKSQPKKGGSHRVGTGTEQHVEHWNCNCGCDSCRHHCAEKPQKEAYRAKQSQRTHLAGQKMHEGNDLQAQMDSRPQQNSVNSTTIRKIPLETVL